MADDTIEINEVNPPNSGRDPFPTFVKRQKAPKNPENKNSTEFFTYEDLGIGKEIDLYGRKFLMYDCDEYTKEFMRQKYGDSVSFDPIDVSLEKPKPISVEPPPYNGYGTEEDSLGSWLYLVLKPPKKDMKKYIENDKKNMRFSAKLVTDKPEDVEREFLITFYLADDTVSIFEPSKRNTGIIGGRFLRRQRVKKPDGSGWYAARDFFVGSTIEIHNFSFLLTQIDEHTLGIMESKPSDFPTADIDSVLQRMRDALVQRHQSVAEAFRKFASGRSGRLSLADLRKMLADMGIDAVEQEVITLMRFFDKNGENSISLEEFSSALAAQGGRPTADRERERSAAPSSSSSSSSSSDKPAMTEDLEKTLRYFREKYDARRLLFQDTFRIMSDRSSDSLIGEPEFKKAVQEQLRLNLDQSELDSLATYFFPPQRRRIGTLDFNKIIEGTSTWMHSKHHHHQHQQQ